MRDAMREVRLALLEADVNYKVARDFTKRVTERAIGAQVMESLTPAQMVIKIVNEELTLLMGGAQARLVSRRNRRRWSCFAACRAPVRRHMRLSWL